MTKFGYDSLNFANMFTLPINPKRENFAFLTNICLQSNLKLLKSSKLPTCICDIFSSLLCLVHIAFAIFKDRYLKNVCSQSCFPAGGCLHSQLQTLLRSASSPTRQENVGFSNDCEKTLVATFREF